LATSASWSSLPNPMPAHECSVHPPMFTDAMPVDAVIASCKLARPPLALMIFRKRTDLPVPADPVKNTLSPRCTFARTYRCSGES
ncbi:hypothetical protein DICSQDRAFT_46552, partial [Dichomitus squalens LYAD-421 SS1]